MNFFTNINTTYFIANNKNEEIENNTYYLYIPTTISSSCGEGQYYLSSKYFHCFKVYKIKIYEDLRASNAQIMNLLLIKMKIAKNVLKEDYA